MKTSNRMNDYHVYSFVCSPSSQFSEKTSGLHTEKILHYWLLLSTRLSRVAEIKKSPTRLSSVVPRIKSSAVLPSTLHCSIATQLSRVGHTIVSCMSHEFGAVFSLDHKYLLHRWNIFESLITHAFTYYQQIYFDIDLNLLCLIFF